MKIRGNVIAKTELKQGVSESSKKEWKTQTVVICENPNAEYPKNVAIEFFGDKTDMLKGLKKDDIIEVSCDVSSREYQGSWYTKVNGWKLENFTQHNNTPQPQKNNDNDDDLPF